MQVLYKENVPLLRGQTPEEQFVARIVHATANFIALKVVVKNKVVSMENVGEYEDLIKKMTEDAAKFLENKGT